MRKELFLYFTSIVFLSTGCSHDTEPDLCIDKQLPGEYFPAYLKNWWTYRNQLNQLVKFEISDDYESYINKCYPEFLNLNYNNHKVYIDGESFFTDAYIGLGSVITIQSIICPDILDSAFICPVAFSSMRVNHYFTSVEGLSTRRVTIALDTTIMLPNSQTFSEVRVVKEYYTYLVDSNNYFYNDYFAKNIGLIKRDSIDGITHVRTQILSLEDYFIGN